ncbi:MAG: HAD hydrolase family protein [Haliscomenobacter sp.]|jgi:3-deoxy-D-manno-octulosonate 8-phosphate phosphatase (KDO 8-P phosphatase)|nr:HAD hydrolase family protein [Haliscomenobacter sp.]MBV6428074.1 3-deoxy-D-manno-octulosonate 8-phosphate phosphatase KdsC [Haliscomenobacter sp.]
MSYLDHFRQVTTFVFDVDGVFTNNEILVTEAGELLRKMNVRDGYAVKVAIQQGYRIAIISGGRSEGVRKRFADLGIEDIYLGKQEKTEAFEEFLHTYDLHPEEILYMGDDLPDYPVMRRVGAPACPNNAAHELLQISVYVSPLNGGEGCVRDVVEQVLRLQGKWTEL